MGIFSHCFGAKQPPGSSGVGGTPQPPGGQLANRPVPLQDLSGLQKQALQSSSVNGSPYTRNSYAPTSVPDSSCDVPDLWDMSKLMQDLGSLKSSSANSWMERLQSGTALLKTRLTPGSLVCVSALLDNHCMSVTLAAHGSGAQLCDVGVPRTPGSNPMYGGKPCPPGLLASVEQVALNKAPLSVPDASTATAAAGFGRGSAPENPKAGGPRAGSLTSKQRLPPDWQVLHSQHGLRSFLALPVMRGADVGGVLTLACPEAWDASPLRHLHPERQAFLTNMVGQMMDHNQLLVACSTLLQVGHASDIDQLTRALGSGVAELCAGAYYQSPTCRVALLLNDATVAVLFEPDPSVAAGFSPPGGASGAIGSSVTAPLMPIIHSGLVPGDQGRGVPASEPALGRGSRNNSRRSLLSGSPVPSRRSLIHMPGSGGGAAAAPAPGAMPGTPPSNGSGMGMVTMAGSPGGGNMAHHMSRRRSVGEIGSPRLARASLDDGGSPCGSPRAPQGLRSRLSQAACSEVGSPYPGSMSIKTSPRYPPHQHHGGPQAWESADCLRDHSVSTSRGNAMSAGGLSMSFQGRPQGLACGHALPVKNTLLHSAIQSPGGAAWVADCTSYLQEGHAYLNDQVISNSNRTVNSMVVAVATISAADAASAAPAAPLSAISVGGAARRASDASSPISVETTAAASGKKGHPLLAAYCTFRVAQPDALLEPLALGLQEMMQVVTPLVWRKLQREMSAEWQLLQAQAQHSLTRHKGRKVSIAESVGSQQSPVAKAAATNMLLADQGHAVLHAASPRASLAGGARVGGSLIAEQGAMLGAGSRIGSSHRSMLQMGLDPADAGGSTTLQASFRIERSAVSASTGNKLAPIMAGVHDKLMQLQMSRLLYGSAMEHEEELEAIMVLDKIGEGGFASVHHGKFHGLDVAIKIMKQGGGGTSEEAGAGGAGGAAGEALNPKSGDVGGMTMDTMSKACEVAVMFSVSHVNIVQVMTFFTDVHVVEEPLPGGRVRMHLQALPIGPWPGSTDESPSADQLQLDGVEGQGHHSVGPRPKGSIVICMELCDMGTLWRAVRKGAFCSKAISGGGGLAGAAGSVGASGTSRHALAGPSAHQPKMYRMGSLYHTLLEVALALRHLHSLNLVHCDLKAANVLLKSNKLDPRGFTCKLSDFGLVKLMAEDEDGNIAIPSDISSGTLTHMAPEIFTRSSKPTSAVDVYAFGIMMYEVITGERAYNGMEAIEAARQVVVNHLRPTWPVGVPVEYRQLAECCWSADPALRPDAYMLVGTLEMLLREFPEGPRSGAPPAQGNSMAAPAARQPQQPPPAAMLQGNPPPRVGAVPQQVASTVLPGPAAAAPAPAKMAAVANQQAASLIPPGGSAAGAPLNPAVNPAAYAASFGFARLSQGHGTPGTSSAAGSTMGSHHQQQQQHNNHPHHHHHHQNPNQNAHHSNHPDQPALQELPNGYKPQRDKQPAMSGSDLDDHLPVVDGSPDGAPATAEAAAHAAEAGLKNVALCAANALAVSLSSSDHAQR